MTQETEVLIAGGGIAGLSLALLLARLGLDVTVLDGRAPPPPGKTAPSGRTNALMQGSVRILEAAGAWADCRKHSAPLETLRIVDQGYTADFRAQEIGLDAFAHNLPNGALLSQLHHEAKRKKNIRLEIPGLFESAALRGQAIDIRLRDGRDFRAALLVGADGRGSGVRTWAGISATETDYGQQAITCLISHSRPHDNISTEFHRAGGPFTLVPLPGNMSSVVWVEKSADAENLMALRKDDFAQALQDRTQDALGRVKIESAPESWPLTGLHAKGLTAPRTALVAEAAHVLHPIGAQGLNLSLRDAALLAETVADHLRLGLDIGSGETLKAYEKLRRPDILARSAGTHGLNKAVSHEFGFLHDLRRAGLKTVSEFTPLRRLAMKQGLQPLASESRLVRGEAL